MKKILLLFLTVITLGCSSVKKTEKALNTGNYDEAITIALNKLSTNKDKKGKQPYILMLEEAFAKVVERDINAVTFLEKENNPANLERIFNTYNTLKNRQERIKPLLPLYIVDKRKNARFDFDNYDQRILSTKEKLSDYLYNNSKNLLSNARGKMDYRKVYDDLVYLDKINPDYRDIKTLIEEAHFKGTDFVRVTMKNRTNMVIPRRLENDLLNFNTYGLNDLWTVYHSKPQRNIKYDYAMELSFREINISPEQIKERELEKERVVKDGWKYLKDKEGNHVLDENGKKIKVDKMVKVRCSYYEITQFKAANVVGNIKYKNLNTKQLIDTFPLSSEYIFQHVYAEVDGDQRAVEDELVSLLNQKAVPFPSNEQMVYDSGEDLKNRLKNIILRYRFKH